MPVILLLVVIIFILLGGGGLLLGLLYGAVAFAGLLLPIAAVVISTVLAIALLRGTLSGLRPGSRRKREAVEPLPSEALDDRGRLDEVWGWYDADIRTRFDDDARAIAQSLYLRGDVLAFERYCRTEVERLDR